MLATSNCHSHSEAIEHAQMTPQFLNHNSTSLPLSPLSLLTPPETSELWYVYEQLLVSCLQCGDDKSANMCLERLAGRFDSSNERVMGLKGMYDEAVAEDSRDLETILQNYRNTLSQRPTNGVGLLRRSPAHSLRITLT